MNSLVFRGKALTAKISLHNMFESTLEFICKLWLMILLNSNSKNKRVSKGVDGAKYFEIQ